MIYNDDDVFYLFLQKQKIGSSIYTFRKVRTISRMVLARSRKVRTISRMVLAAPGTRATNSLSPVLLQDPRCVYIANSSHELSLTGPTPRPSKPRPSRCAASMSLSAGGRLLIPLANRLLMSVAYRWHIVDESQRRRITHTHTRTL